MSIAEILLLAVALAMDAFAVSWAAGAMLGTATFRQSFRLAWHFGLFQAAMPVLGWLLGQSLYTLIQSFDHWVAFGLLLVVGGRMVVNSLRCGGEECRRDPTRGMTLVALSVATSIDALAVGLSLGVIEVGVLFPALVIGLVAAAFSVLGIQLGRLMGRMGRLSGLAELLGGLVLLGIGVKILIEHGVFS